VNDILTTFLNRIGNQKHPNHGHQGGATGSEPAETD
jgi:hypothetical protein